MVNSSFKLAELIEAVKPLDSFSVTMSGVEFRFKTIKSRDEQKNLEDEVKSKIKIWLDMKSWPKTWEPRPESVAVLAECAYMLILSAGIYRKGDKVQDALSDQDVFLLVKVPAFGEAFGDQMNSSQYRNLTDIEVDKVMNQKKDGKSALSS